MKVYTRSLVGDDSAMLPVVRMRVNFGAAPPTDQVKNWEVYAEVHERDTL